MNRNAKAFRTVVTICVVVLLLQFSGCSALFSKQQAEAAPSPLMNNTTWITDDNSEVVFTEDRIDWYQSAENHEDNYYSGKYQFYIGQDAVQYITKNLSEYRITKQKLENLFKRSSKYDESCFVVFDIRYDRFLLDGEEQTIDRPLVPWYGFLLEDGTFLDVANMNTGTYYPFKKQT